MKRKDSGGFLYALLWILGIIFVVGFVVGEIFAWTLYGGKPIGEIPMWAWIFMFGGGR